MIAQLPRLLIFFRAAAALVILAFPLLDPGARLVLVAIIWAGLLSDILDGMVARRAGLDTDNLRRLDSAVDVLFWLSVLSTALWLEPGALQPWSLWLLGLIFGEGLIYAVNRIRFRRGSATHAWSAKLFGLALLAGFSELFLTGATGTLFVGMIVTGYLALLDVLAIALILPHWARDVPSLYHAIRMRRAEGH